MAGAGAKLFTSGAVLTADQVNTYLMDQSIMRFADTTARDAAFGGAGEPVLAEGMFAYTSDTDTLWFYTGSVWEVATIKPSLVDAKGDLLAGTADNTVGRLAVGTNGQFLIADSSESTGLKWGAGGISNFATTQEMSTQSTASSTYTDLATVTSVTVTTGVNALCVWHCTALNNTSNAGVFVSIAVSGATTVAASDNISNFYQSPSSSLAQYVPYASGHIFTGLTAGSNTFTIKFRTTGGTAFFSNRGIQVLAL